MIGVPQIIGGVAGGLLGGLFGGDDDITNDIEGLSKGYTEALRRTYGSAADILKAGRLNLNPLWTPFGPTPFLGPAGMPEAANLGFGAYMQGAGAYDWLTDPSRMLDVAQNPYVNAMANRAANEAQRRTSATAFGSGNYGGGAHQRAAAGAITDAMGDIYGKAYGQGLAGMNQALGMTGPFTGIPMELMNQYQMSDYNWLNPYTANVVAGGQPGYASANSTNPLSNILGGAMTGMGIGGMFNPAPVTNPYTGGPQGSYDPNLDTRF